MDLISHQQGKWSVQKHLIANGFFFVSNGWLKRPGDGRAELRGQRRSVFYGIRPAAGASSPVQGRHWEVTGCLPGESGEQDPRTD